MRMKLFALKTIFTEGYDFKKLYRFTIFLKKNDPTFLNIDEDAKLETWQLRMTSEQWVGFLWNSLLKSSTNDDDIIGPDNEGLVDFSAVIPIFAPLKKLFNTTSNFAKSILNRNKYEFWTPNKLVLVFFFFQLNIMLFLNQQLQMFLSEYVKL